MKSSKKILRRLTALVLAAAFCLSGVSAFAAPGDFTDVPSTAWYAGDVAYVFENNLMTGTGETTFSPNVTTTRAMLVTTLYRQAGSPAVTDDPPFTDVAPGRWYSNPISWAAANNITSGYGNGLFGINDPVTREQLISFLWRAQGSPAPGSDVRPFADMSRVSSYAESAVLWGREQGILSGTGDNRCEPRATATRAQMAAMLHRWLVGPEEPASSQILVATFSATGNTGRIAGYISSALQADSYSITPAVPYTAADLDYNNSTSRVSQERTNANSRPAITGGVDNMEDYDVIFLGYPIWWGDAPKIILTFLESYDLSGKTIIPFCTSGSSGIGSSATNLHPYASSAVWQSGRRFGGSASQSEVTAWAQSLTLA